tara:strand:+ start:227 stop:430 length:204 start_codon:yes stop_codon:yes gene_type:complete
MYNIYVLNDDRNILNNKPIKTKKLAKEFLKEIYLNEHVPFFELNCRGKLDSFSFKDFLEDYKIVKTK